MKTVFIFPGQGAQSVGMLDQFAADCDEVRETFDRASAVLSKDLYALVSKGPKEALDATVNTQPVMLAACFALWEIWQKRGGVAPDVAAGHSFGEYTALVCCGAISFEDGIRTAAKRGELMQNAVAGTPTAMAAVMGVDADELGARCQKAAQESGQVVEMVNFNAPAQIVIAGQRDAVEGVVSGVKASKAGKAVVLPVSVPAHSSLMKPAADALAAFLDTIEVRRPRVPVVQNVEAHSCETPGEIKAALGRQLHSPVQWSKTILELQDYRFVELGPGQVLTGINKRIDRKIVCHPTDTPDKLEQAIAATGGVP